jgi:hypothetical protein
MICMQRVVASILVEEMWVPDKRCIIIWIVKRANSVTHPCKMLVMIRFGSRDDLRYRLHWRDFLRLNIEFEALFVTAPILNVS